LRWKSCPIEGVRNLAAIDAAAVHGLADDWRDDLAQIVAAGGAKRERQVGRRCPDSSLIALASDVRRG